MTQVGNPPYCPKCGISAQQAFAQLADKKEGPTPFGVCTSCFELVQLVPAGEGVAPFLEVVSNLTAPAALIQMRTNIRMQLGGLQ